MAHFQNQLDNPQARQAEYDEFGKPVVRSVDEYGNPIGQRGTVGAYPGGTGMTGGTPLNLGGHHEGGGGVLRRSGSSSSSSSEDDGQGGRRKKKGIKEKIKEKIPGVGHKQDEWTQASYGTTTAEYGAGAEYEQPHEKKGMMEKIKEKLPGHHHQI